MRSAHDLANGLSRLKAILQEFPPESEHWNEAQNRFQFIDRLLIECLGWQTPQISVEQHDENGGRADYILGSLPARAVLEAKRQAIIFEGISNQNPGRICKLADLSMMSKNFLNAASQVIPYCAMRGAPIAIICNGPQLIVFQAITPGMPPLEGECYFFDGYTSYVRHFTLLWKLLSPEGIHENRAYRDLALHRNPRIPPKASESIPEPNRFRYRNELEEELRALSSMLLEEIEDNPDLKSSFYQECYVPIEANNRHLLLSKQIIEARYRRAGVDTNSLSSLDSATRSGVLNDQFTMGAKSRPIVVLGEVGVGKTSFFENLYQNIQKNTNNETYYIHIDLGTKGNLSSSLKETILDTIQSTLLKKYAIDINSSDFIESIYHKDLKSFEKTPTASLKEQDPLFYAKERVEFIKSKMSKLDKHIIAALSHLSFGRRKRIILVIDNADQRNFDIQQEAFLIAQELAASRSIFVFVALRPSTFYLSKKTGALSGYQNKVLTISPPPADVVIDKRINFALRVAEGHVAPAELDNIRLQLKSIVAFLTATLRSIRRNSDIRQFLSNITGGNTRAVIEMVTSFCGSPNVDAEKIINIELERGEYVVPLHEFTKHALLGEYAYFNPNSSVVAQNVFDISYADPKEHFLCSLIVSFLSSSTGSRDNDGFALGAKVSDEISKHGFIEEQIKNALKRLALHRLIETPYLHFRELSVDDYTDPLTFHYRASSIGIYHVRHWTGSFAFLDATSTDTPIFDDEARHLVSRHAASFEIEDRFRKTEAFKRYLEEQWHASGIHCSYYNFTNLIDAGQESFRLVQQVVERRERRRVAPFRPHSKGMRK